MTWQERIIVGLIAICCLGLALLFGYVWRSQARHEARECSCYADGQAPAPILSAWDDLELRVRSLEARADVHYVCVSNVAFRLASLKGRLADSEYFAQQEVRACSNIMNRALRSVGSILGIVEDNTSEILTLKHDFWRELEHATNCACTFAGKQRSH